MPDFTTMASRAAGLAAWRDTAEAVANWGGGSRDFAGLFAVPVGFLVLIGVSLFKPAPWRDVQSFVEDLREPELLGGGNPSRERPLAEQADRRVR